MVRRTNATFIDGVLKPDEDLPLREGERVVVEVVRVPPPMAPFHPIP